MKRSKAVRLLYVGVAVTALQGCDDDPRPRDYVETPAIERVAAEGSYFSMQECLTRYDADICQASFAAAHAEYMQNAPKFASQESCEAFSGPGMCQTDAVPAAAASETTGAAAPAQTASSGGSVFVPAMLGFMVGQAIGNMSGAGRGYYAGPPQGCDRYQLNARPGSGPCAPAARSGGGSSFAAGAVYSTTRAGRDAPFSGGAVRSAPVPAARVADTRVSGSTPAAVRAAPAAPRASSATTSRSGFGSTGRSYGGVSSGS